MFFSLPALKCNSFCQQSAFNNFGARRRAQGARLIHRFQEPGEGETRLSSESFEGCILPFLAPCALRLAPFAFTP
jgi:hypothetical protein